MELVLKALGIKVSNLIAVMIGSTIAIIFDKEISPWLAVFYIVIALSFSYYTTPLLIQYFGLNLEYINFFWFILGLISVKILKIFNSIVKYIENNPGEFLKNILSKRG